MSDASAALGVGASGSAGETGEAGEARDRRDTPLPCQDDLEAAHAPFDGDCE